MVSVARCRRPRSCAPIATRQRARSTISGSRAALAITVSPSASAAAISRFSVAPDRGLGETRCSRPSGPCGAGAGRSRSLELDLGAQRLQALEVQVDRARRRWRSRRAARPWPRRSAPAAGPAPAPRRASCARGHRAPCARGSRGACSVSRARARRPTWSPRRPHAAAGAASRRCRPGRARCRAQRLVGQQAGGHDRQGGVLGAADRDGAVERRPPRIEDAVHGLRLLARAWAGSRRSGACICPCGRHRRPRAAPSPLRNRNWQMPSLA